MVRLLKSLPPTTRPMGREMTRINQGPVRVLHVLGRMNPGGIETWLLNVHRQLDPRELSFDYLTTQNAPGAYDGEIRDLGGRIFPLNRSKNPILITAQIRRIVAQHGPYDVIHSHLSYYSGIVLRAAHAAGVPIRLSHSHTDQSTANQNAPIQRRIYIAASRALLRRHGTAHLAASPEAAASLHGPNWARLGNVFVSECGVDFSEYTELPDAAQIRSMFGIPPGALVVGTVGRLVPSKNHAFLLEAFSQLSTTKLPPPYLVIVGDGPLRNDLQLLSRDLGIADRVKLIGARQDVPKLLLGLFDVFAFPSKFEGLGLAAIEAQAAGLPCVISSSVPSSAIIVPENVSYLPVSVEPAEWARELVRKHNAPRLPRKLALLRALSSSYSIERSVQRLYHFYGLQPNHA